MKNELSGFWLGSHVTATFANEIATDYINLVTNQSDMKIQIEHH
jgi:hypothetical protein